MVEKTINEFNIQNFETCCTILVLGPPGSGKSTLIENIMYYNQHKYPSCKTICNVETNYMTYCDIVPPLFVHKDFIIEKEESSMTIRQKESVRTYTNLEISPRLLLYVLDDVGLDRSHLNHNFFKDLFKLGSRHYPQMTIIGNQYPIDFPPQLRTCGSYIILFNYPDNVNRKKLYDNFGGDSLFHSFDNFKLLMDTFTGNYGYVVLSFREQTNDIEKRVFYGKTEQIPNNWVFGCREYVEWDKQRCKRKYDWD